MDRHSPRIDGSSRCPLYFKAASSKHLDLAAQDGTVGRPITRRHASYSEPSLRAEEMLSPTGLPSPLVRLFTLKHCNRLARVASSTESASGELARSKLTGGACTLIADVSIDRMSRLRIAGM